jgi:hypothetical protein
MRRGRGERFGRQFVIQNATQWERRKTQRTSTRAKHSNACGRFLAHRSPAVGGDNDGTKTANKASIEAAIFFS